MCGICGYVNLSKNRQDMSVLQKMVQTLNHRGPDSQGYYEDNKSQVYLGHARLSVIDITDNGRQPMSLGNLTIVFNGEIYNYKEIKEELYAVGHSFMTNSDTEVILHSYQEWGVTCITHFIGMFAFCIYNSENQTLTLFRDRAGVKPLYFYFDKNAFIFGSELKVFHCNPLFHKELDFDVLGLYMRYGYIPAPHCVFKNAYKLAQGSYLVFDIQKSSYNIHRYWDLKPFYLKPKLQIPYEEAMEEAEQIMISAFNYRMISDVPVGVFLSAGFDSTCVAALLQKRMTDKLRTFTIGFENGNNEAPMAKKIAHYLGTDHSEHYCSQADALDIVKDLPYYYDEPFADSSAIPTTLVSKIARQQVKVALSADGGDEIFAGYQRYDYYFSWKRKVHDYTKAFKDSLNYILRLHHDKKKTTCYDEIFTKSVNKILTIYDDRNDNMTELSRLLYSDYVQYLPDDILVKVDRASMSNSLEGRNPLLDHRIVEFAAQLPDEFKYSKGVKKRILKDIVYKYVPKELLDKPKTGFSVPLSCWLNENLKDMVNYYLSDEKVKEFDLFNHNFVNYAKNKLNTTDENAARELWKILQLQMWYEHWMRN